MREYSLSEFKSEIDSINKYVKYLDLINKMGSSTSGDLEIKKLKNHLRSFGVSKKIFEYKAIIISLYGLLEKYIAIWIKEHADNISSFPIKYDMLTLKLREKHFALSVILMSKIIDGKNAKYDDLNKEDVLNKLNACVNNTDNKLNGEAFYPLSGNLKHLKILDAFKVLEINIESCLKNNRKFKEYLKEIHNGANVANIGSDLFALIDEVVTRRNDIAHGEEIVDIINLNDFERYLSFIANYGEAIFESILEKEIEYEEKFFYDEIKVIKNVFSKGSVLCFEIENNTVKIGDFIIVRTISGNWKKIEILEIEKEKMSYEKLLVNEKTDIGVKLNNTVSVKETFYIKKNTLHQN